MRAYLPKLDVSDIKILEDIKGLTHLSADGTFLKFDLTDWALVLLDGDVTVLKNESPFIQINPGYVIGLKKLVRGLPANLRCQARNARFISLTKEDIKIPVVYDILEKFIL